MLYVRESSEMRKNMFRNFEKCEYEDFKKVWIWDARPTQEE